MPLYYGPSIPFEKMRAIKEKTLRYGLTKAREMDPSARWIAREVFPGDDDATDFNDFDWKTAQSSTDFVGWMQDDADLTTDTLSSVFSSGETVNPNQIVIWYGMFDLKPVHTYIKGVTVGVGGMPGFGSLNKILFKRGSSELDIWGTEHVYLGQNVVAFSDRVVQFLEKQKIDLQMDFTRGTEDQFIGLRGYLFEKDTEHVSTGWESAWSGSKYMKPGEFSWGVDPVQELTAQEMWQKKKMVSHNLVQKLLDEGVANNPEQIVVREVIVGDETNVANFVDLNTKTAAVSGQTNWMLDAADLTTDQFSSVLASGEQVDDNKAIGFYGFWDKDATPSLTRLAFKDGSATRAVFEVEHCYAYRNGPVAGLFQRPIYYEEKEKIDLQFAFRDASVDHNTGLYGLVAERWGDHISKE